MLTDIEANIVTRLKAKLTGAKRIAVDEAHSDLSLIMPVTDVIVGGGTFVRVTQQYKLSVNVFVIVTFQNLQNVEQRRKGVYPILEAIMALLTDHQLGLKIEPLKPKRLDNITEEKEADEGKVVFQIEFETGFIITSLSDEEVEDLLSIGMNYFLKPGDEVADASDLVTLQEED